MKKLVVILFLSSLAVKNAPCAQKWGENVTQTYESKDGTIYTAELQLRNTGNGGDGYIKFNGRNISHGDFNIAYYNNEGEIIKQSFYYAGRPTIVADENNNIIAIQKCWGCDIVDTFKYTDSDKILVYSTDGHLKGAYDNLLGYYISNMIGVNVWNGMPTNVIHQYLGYDLNLISEDGNFYDYDKQGKLQGVYYPDGKSQTYKYSPNGDYALYDNDGNFLGHFMSNGEKRRIYTVNEATAVTKKGAKNKFTIRYR